MKNDTRKILFALSIIGTILLSIVACENKESTGTQSTVAQIVSFAFAANDSFPGLGEAIFVVEERTDTGLIRMRKNDSIRYGTPINSVVPSITYYTTPSAVTFYLGDQAVQLTGYDTLDLSNKPILIHVVAQNKDYDKWYKLDFNVHTMDGDLFHWDTVCTSIPGANTHGFQKALLRKNTFYYYQNDGHKVRLFTSDNQGESKSWQEHTVTGLPDSCNVRQIVEGDQYFFYGKGKDFYYSSNGIDWKPIQKDPLKIDIMALYMCMNVRNIYQLGDSVRLWLAARDSLGTPRFYTVGADINLQVAKGVGLPGDSLPSNFPIEDFATIPFQSSSLHQHGLIAGGYDRHHHMTNARWNLEYNYISNTYRLTDMASSNRNVPAFTGSSISYYNDYLYLLGGMYQDRVYLGNAFVSIDEGVHWTEVTDEQNSKRPKDMKGRYQTNTFVHGTNLYIIGGEDNSTTYSDVYRGRQNSITWEPIGD